MKLPEIRRFWHVFVVLTCCCIPIAFASSAVAARFSFAGWIQLSPTNPPPARSYLAMTYDPVSGKVITFGGFDGTGYLMTRGASTAGAGRRPPQNLRLQPELPPK
jgi:hypothetical protein